MVKSVRALEKVLTMQANFGFDPAFAAGTYLNVSSIKFEIGLY